MDRIDCFLNGRFLPPEQARIPVMDRGFLFGDGVYEVIPCYGGRLFRLAHHLRRLETSLHGIGMTDPLGPERWREVLERLAGQRPGTDQSVYLQVTRGAAPARDHRIPRDVEPTVFAMASPLPTPDPRLAEHGIKAITRPDIRWGRCDIKAITLLANVMLREEATQAGVGEALLIRDGFATEGSASNLFAVRDATLLTPPTSRHLLPGITRDLVLELAAAGGLAYREVPISEQQLRTADEVWITSSTREVVPVTRLDGVAVGDGVPGPVFGRMRQLYADYKRSLQQGRGSE